jgi:hypothetical protein
MVDGFCCFKMSKVIELINPILRGWVNYFAVGPSSRCFAFIEDWRRARDSKPHSHREATATAPVLDSTRSLTRNRAF